MDITPQTDMPAKAHISFTPSDRLGAILNEVASRAHTTQAPVVPPNDKPSRSSIRQRRSDSPPPSSSPQPAAKRTPAAALKLTQKALHSNHGQFPNSASNGEHINPEKNPTNLTILRLRNEDGLKWEDISSTLNDGLFYGDDVTDNLENFTKENVYSRYARTTHRLAVLEEEKATTESKRKRNEIKAKKRGKLVEDDGAKEFWNDELDLLLVEAVGETRREFWDDVARRIVAKGGKRINPADCERRYAGI